MLKIICSLLAICLLSSAAEAKYRHTHKHHHKHYHKVSACKAYMIAPTGQSKVVCGKYIQKLNTITGPNITVSDVISKPARFIAGRLICAINVNAALAERGIKGTGSALAKSFLHWGHGTSNPKPGDVIVFNRRGGGHTAIVSRVVGGTVFMWNPSARQQRWVETPLYKRPIGYRTI